MSEEIKKEKLLDKIHGRDEDTTQGATYVDDKELDKNIQVRELAQELAGQFNFRVKKNDRRKTPFSKKVKNGRNKEKNRRKQNRRK